MRDSCCFENPSEKQGWESFTKLYFRIGR